MAEWTHTIEDGMLNEENLVIDERGKVLICDTPYYPHVDLDLPQWRLVAAVPELLEALEGLMEAAEFANQNNSPFGFYSANIEAAQKAIAKANGRI